MRAVVLLMATAALLTACASGLWSTRSPPEIWLMMGQSNMSGRGNLADLPLGWNAPDTRIRVLGNDGVLRPAMEPLDSAEGQIDAVSADTIAAVGPGLAFAKARLAIDGRRRIVLVPCAKGGTSVVEWEPTLDRSTLFGSCIARAAAAKAHGRLAGALWYQGESDTRTAEAAETWASLFSDIVRAVRAEAQSPALPFIVVCLGDPPITGELAGRYPHWETVRRAQDALTLPAVWLVPARGLPKKTDDLHLSTAGQLELGRRLAETSEVIYVDNSASRPD